MELILIRHGLPERIENDDGTPADPPLSAEGQRQADRLAAWLADEPIDRLYASPMLRARQTARPLSERKGLELELEPGVVEWDQHSEIYIPIEELKRDFPEQWRAMMRGEIRTGIDLSAFQKLVVESLDRIIADNRGGRVAVVCHGGVINAWSAHVLGLDNPTFFLPDYTSIHRFLAASSGERSVGSLNDVGHLRAL